MTIREEYESVYKFGLEPSRRQYETVIKRTIVEMVKPLQLGYHGLGKLVIEFMFDPLNMLGVYAAMTGRMSSVFHFCPDTLLAGFKLRMCTKSRGMPYRLF